MDLIIVESPTKAKTIASFLGQKFKVIASKGHIRDLPDFRFGIKVANGKFTPEYEIDKDHKALVDEISSVAKKAKTTYIATDEDREGEAIGYHITQALGGEASAFPRIVFHEITKSAIAHALENPKRIDMDKVNAQQARRLLDRIVGFKLSQLISSKIQRGLSAGRVQSAALKILVDREREIQAFKPVVYFMVDGVFEKNIEAQLSEFGGKKIEKLTLQDKKAVDSMVSALKGASYAVKSIAKKTTKTKTPAPFMTSTLQQAASTALGYSPSRTMQIAQRLYEGVSTDQGMAGVITYMRTDSLNIAAEAQDAARAYIAKVYGKEYVPETKKIYTSKAKGAQEAHEAIRPSRVEFSPQVARAYLKPDELKLYTLIYNRFLASQSVDASIESQSIEFEAVADSAGSGADSKDGVSANGAKFKATGSVLVFDGFYKISGRDDKDKSLPSLKEGQKVSADAIKAVQKQTEPPARFNEASLIKTLESLGIGRPSTYAPTVSLLVNREYIVLKNKAIHAQECAFKVISLLEAHFGEIVDSDFSASLEEKLDEIAESKRDWEATLWEFYEPFMDKVESGKKNIASQKKAAEPTGEMCPECGKELVLREGRYGAFVACSGYPKCKFVKREMRENISAESSGMVCEKCGRPMVEKRGRRGAFMACSGYPECKNAKSMASVRANGGAQSCVDSSGAGGDSSAESKSASSPKVALNENGEVVKCPDCKGDLIQRYSRMGAFFGCSNYPKCKFLSKFLPNGETCPECQGPLCSRTLRNKPIKECLKCKHRIEV